MRANNRVGGGGGGWVWYGKVWVLRTRCSVLIELAGGSSSWGVGERGIGIERWRLID